jgi:hypothetical protein
MKKLKSILQASIKEENSKIFTILFFLIITYIFSITSFNNQKSSGTNNWKSSLWADQGGYYLYLPAYFKYQMKADKLPEQTWENLGRTFMVDTINNKILDKYALGVAVMELPVYIIVDIYAKANGLNDNGFDGVYHLIPVIAALLYFLGAIILLRLFLRNFFNNWLCLLIIAIISLGTNVYYYAIYSPGMSHIFSFFLFSLLLFLVGNIFIRKSKKEYLNVSLLAFTLAMIVLVRPINFIAILLIFAGVENKTQIIERVKYFLSWKKISVMAMVGFLVLLPQFLYWHSISGNFFYYSYGDESFTHLFSPKFTSFWFAPLNGHFLYNPLYFLLIFAAIFFIFKKSIDAFIALILFLFISYISASWHMYYFGCGFGARNIVEYSVAFAVPLGYLLRSIRSLTAKVFFPLFIVFSIFINLHLSEKLERCFFGKDWDWHEYKHLLFSKKFEVKNDYELKGERFSNPVSGKKVRRVLPKEEYIEGIQFFQKDKSLVNVRNAQISFFINTESKYIKDAELVVSMQYESAIVFYKSFRLSDKIQQTDNWIELNYLINFPKYSLIENKVNIYFWNKSEDAFLIDLMKVTFK